MGKDVYRRLSDLKSRRRGNSSTIAMDSITANSRSISEKFETRSSGQWAKYALGIMQEVDPTYTQNSVAEGERVKNQITTRISTEVKFEYQGSVPLNVHIRGVSDIDILVLLSGYLTIDLSGSRANTTDYSNWVGQSGTAQLAFLRSELESALKAAYPAADVDITKDKAIALSGGSLLRKVDVVPSHWHDSANYQTSKNKKDREVKIYQKVTDDTLLNRPFLHIDKINQKEAVTRGGAKKTIRMLKNLKADSENPSAILVNSYEIAGLVFHFEDTPMSVPAYNELALVAVAKQQLTRMMDNKLWAMGLMTPDGIRRIIDSEEKFKSLTLLRDEVSELGKNLAVELTSRYWIDDLETLKALRESYIAE
ncbi:Uncharacterized protein ABJ99_0112 [Pseudomonas syringae pv. cilantro]|uniref:cGAS/DncV-like nucleotidyltransferase C-terminal helical domain-containing protein n=2 Tax=Pseudomonas syringae group TaxID=136849 RepID=A0A0N0X8N9_PSESX|nr:MULTISPECIES: hypothetical protein [Pseudomonas syringae group]KPC27616.1 Uncharacterized protein ABJ99_0112 [Pseudomonas syringae pv. cilantro]KPW71272.1 Uncharacterized protein ALO76_00609 [Pseudomonas syringae pv. coriandricola]RMN09693.1 hypothetical protein ALQ65_02330 [Pseudomonas syringae pv. coriandricola]